MSPCLFSVIVKINSPISLDFVLRYRANWVRHLERTESEMFPCQTEAFSGEDLWTVHLYWSTCTAPHSRPDIKFDPRGWKVSRSRIIRNSTCQMNENQVPVAHGMTNVCRIPRVELIPRFLHRTALGGSIVERHGLDSSHEDFHYCKLVGMAQLW